MTANLYGIRLIPPVSGPAERIRTLTRAYALAAAADPHLTPGEWTAFVRRCRRQAQHRGGLGVLEDRRGYVHAVFRYAVGAGPLAGAGTSGRGRTMWLQDIVLGRLPGSAAARAIAAGGEMMARAFGCGAVAVELPARVCAPPSGTPFAPLVQRGYGVALGTILVRALNA